MKARIALGVVGLIGIGYGARLVLQGGDAIPLRPLVTWLIGLDILSDGLLLPLAAVVGWFLARRLSPRVRPPVQSGLVVAGVLGLVAIPVVNGAGRDPLNPTILPGNYPLGLAVALAVVAVATAVAVLIRLRSPAMTAQAANDMNSLPSTDHDSRQL